MAFWNIVKKTAGAGSSSRKRREGVWLKLLLLEQERSWIGKARQAAPSKSTPLALYNITWMHVLLTPDQTHSELQGATTKTKGIKS